MAEVYLQSPLFAESISHKTCTKCRVSKPLDAYGPSRQSRDGCKSQCRRCHADVMKQFTRKNRDRLNKTRRDLYATDPEYKQARRAVRKRQNIEHRDTVDKNNKKWRAANPEAYKATKRRWKRKNAKKLLDYARIRGSRIRGRFVEKISRSVVIERDGGICHICKKAVDPNNWHLDHVIPVARGGDHSYKNVAVSHPMCNFKKHTRLVEELTP